MARDNALEKWLREEVIAVYDEAKLQPENLIYGKLMIAQLLRVSNSSLLLL